MGKTKQSESEDMYAHTAGAVGVLVMVFAGLTAIKVRLGVPWPVAVLLTVGALVLLGYAAWWAKTRIVRLWRKGPVEAPSSTAVVQEFSAESADEAEGPAAHAELTTVMVRSGAIGRDQIIRADEASVTDLRNGALYDFQMPEGRTYEHVEKNLSTIAGMFRVTRLHMKLERSRENERRVQMLKLHEPPFTRPFAAPTRGEIEAFSGVPLGHDITGELIGVKTLDKASMLIAGMTQTGKSTLGTGLLTSLLITHGNEFDSYLLDGKLCALTSFEPVAVRYEASDDPAVLESMLDEVLPIVERRYEKIQEAKRNRKPIPKFRLGVFLVDEAADFFVDNGTAKSKELVRRVEEKSRKLAAKGLECGFSVIFLTQRPDKDAIPVKVRAQFQYRICLYVDSEGAAKVALGDSYFTTNAPIPPQHLNPDIKGQAVLFANGRSTLMRGFHFEDTFMWEAIDGVIEQRKAKFAEMPVSTSPLAQAIELMRSNGVQHMTTAELAAVFNVVEADAGKVGKELKELLGASPGRIPGGRGYRLANLIAASTSDT
ncbi:FtsK/SpoIIIE domain-containing protein [Streptomyces sp. NRRL F-2747]|uniref:FtsK/SpoIIIE domain-containing protein n=1 Tax=Streptomyces sp. NRRL F-2747 TaxID=1463843 RepID=UPI0004C7B487|nr:FtsK/SpoIIIE domain-containing protein [Streptomyces sp. NRRL F-2747]